MIEAQKTRFLESVTALPASHFEFAQQKMGVEGGDIKARIIARIEKLLQQGTDGSFPKIRTGLDKLGSYEGETVAHGICKSAGKVVLLARGPLIQCGFDNSKVHIDSQEGLSHLAEWYRTVAQVEWPNGEAPDFPTQDEVWYLGTAHRGETRFGLSGWISNAPIFDPKTREVRRVNSGYGKAVIPALALPLV